MCRFVSGVITIFVMCHLNYTTGYKWIALKDGDPIPENAIEISSRGPYVGRAIHYNLVLPVEVFNSTYARTFIISEKLAKQHFEVLVATEHCEWKKFDFDYAPSENVVRGGTAWNGEPIYVGRSNYRIAFILLALQQVYRWPDNNYSNVDVLICVGDDDSKWIDSSSGHIPNNTISGGKSEDNYDIFVSRLLGPTSFVPGQVIPELNTSTAVYQKYTIRSLYCQVLVGDASKYIWKYARYGEIPDYAIIGGVSETNELMYVARLHRTLGYIVHSEGLNKKMIYDILVKNV